jgi:hypothetical protein
VLQSLFLIFAAVFVTSPAQPAESPVDVSLVRVIANPERFDGKLVSLIGFLRIEPEGTALYLSSEDYQHQVFGNALRVELNEQLRQDREELDMNYVHIVGVFDARHLGQMPFPSGSITNVSKWHLWSELDHPRAQKYKERWKKDSN